MKNLFEAIAEYMSAEGSEARRESAKKVRIEFDLVQDRVQEMQSRIEALEKDAERYRWLRTKGRYEGWRVEEPQNGWMRTHSASSIDAAIDAAMQAEKGGV